MSTTAAIEEHPAMLAPDASAAASAVRYFEQITLRVRAGRLPDAVVERQPRRRAHQAPRSDLTPSLRAHIERLLHRGDMSQDEIARAVGCSQTTVCRVASELH